MITDVRRHLPQDADRVAVIAPDDADLRQLGALVARLRPDRDPTRLHDALVPHGHLDAVLDLARGPAVAERVAMLLGHVRRGGRLVVALPRRDDARQRVLALVDDVRDLQGSGLLDPPARRRDDRPAAERDRHALAASVAEVVVDGDLVVLTMAVETWHVVPERRLDAVLETAPDLGRVVVHEPAVTWTPSAPFTSSDPDEAPLGEVSAPALSLREHHDVVVAPRMVAHLGGVLLPQAFRNTVRRRPRTPVLTDWTPWAVRVPSELGSAAAAAAEPLAGTWFHADNILRGHFGHAMTEQLSLLWAWAAALEAHPDLGLLVSDAAQPVAGWELELLEAAGVPRERVRAVPGPVRVERLLAATPAYVIGRHVHPVVRDVQRRAGDHLESRSGLDTVPERLFLTRRGTKRACRNDGEVEALFERHGFTVVAPEEHPLADQVAMVRGARAVGGFGGSGLFHLALGGPPRPVVVVSSRAYHVWNERAVAAVWDHPLTVVRGTPDIGPAPDDGFSLERFHSSYAVDLDREGHTLVAALQDLV